jgi:lipid-A-disaccharide synthase
MEYTMRIFFSVGEPSGDLHAANLIRCLREQDPTIECVGFGGPQMEAAGCSIRFDLTQMAVMFVWGALAKLPAFWRLIQQAEQYFCQQRVDAVVLIDYPGFNWWIARKAKRHGIPVFYYGVPQMWAWGPWRVKKIRKYVDHVLCKLPFEVDWFAKRNCRATYVGHPYFDQLQRRKLDQRFLADCQTDSSRLVTLLPGSRNQEVKSHLPTLYRAAAEIQRNTGARIAVACFNSNQMEMARQELANYDLKADLWVGRTPELMFLADACLACSGSVSLELMYFRKPTVIVYRLNWIFMLIQALGLRVKYITLVNLMAAPSIERTHWRAYDPDAPKAAAVPMPEYLSATDKSAFMAAHVMEWLRDDQKRLAIVRWLDRLACEYAWPGASSRAAKYILQTLSNDRRIGTRAA